MLRFIVLVFMSLALTNAHSSDFNRESFRDALSALDSISGNKIMREEVFNRDYGLLYEVAQNIKSFYDKGMSEANTTFKDHMYYFTYLFFIKESELKEDLEVENLRLILSSLYESILDIVKMYGWEVTFEGRIYKGEEVSSLPAFSESKKEVKYNGSFLTKIFSATLKKIIDSLLEETVLSERITEHLKLILKQVEIIQASKNPSDLSRKIHKASKKIITEFDKVEEGLRLQARALRRNGNLKALELIEKVRLICNSLKELKNFGKNYSY